jgi:hypothetical protein
VKTFTEMATQSEFRRQLVSCPLTPFSLQQSWSEAVAGHRDHPRAELPQLLIAIMF